MTIRYLHIILRALLTLVWTPTLVLAAVVAQPDSALNVHPVVVVLSFVFSTLAGATTLAMRINKGLDCVPPRKLASPWLYCVAHMGGSWLSGSLAFFGSQSYHLDVWIGLAVVLMFSFGGAAMIEASIKKYLPSFPVPDLEHAYINRRTHAVETVPAELSDK